MSVMRYRENPLISVNDVEPSRDDFHVVGVFNPGVAKLRNQTILLLRVAESPNSVNRNSVLTPSMNFDLSSPAMTVRSLDRNEPGLDFSDSRGVFIDNRMIALTSISHFRVARSDDGRHFEIDDNIRFLPQNRAEAWGIEDPRITTINGVYYITYSAVSENGVSVALATTTDFTEFKRESCILPPTNKDVVLFPETILGQYYALHRPAPSDIGTPDIWVSTSPDLIHWGNHRYLAGVREDSWDSQRIGAGAVPIRTKDGWLVLYHGANRENQYSMGALLLDIDNPNRVMGRSRVPFLKPEESYETNGFWGAVVFSCGAIVEDDTIHMYYGAADQSIAGCEVPLKDIFDTF